MTDILVRILNLPIAVQRKIAASLFALACAAVFLSLYLVYSVFAQQYETLAEGRLMLARLDRLIASDASNSSSTLSVSQSQGPEFLSGSNDAIIQASLQSKFNAIAAVEGATVISSGAIAAAEKDGLRYLALRATIEGPTKAIYNTLFQIEMAKPYLIIDELTIRGPASNQNAEGPISLSAQVVFSGIIASKSDHQ